MNNKKLGNQTVKFSSPPIIISTGSIVGPKEGQGPLSLTFDRIIEDEMFGEQSWEKAESKLMKEAFGIALNKGQKSFSDIDYVIAGDLLDQSIATTFGFKEVGIPFLGVYGACSTMAESISVGSFLIDGGFSSNVACLTSSHFCSAEKQFRFPLELGSPRSPTAQWTVTGSGCVILSDTGPGPKINYVTTGKIIDYGIKDANNMGAAMAPAAADTIYQHFIDTGLTPESYDLIVTGDLGKLGGKLCNDLLTRNDFNLGSKYTDCGVLIFDTEKQDVQSGGSGCGCSATTFAGYLYSQMLSGEIKNLLFVATGALLSPISSKQGESIPSIAHAVSISI